MTMLPPYYYKNKEWYTKDKNGKIRLTDKAPKKARDSFIAYWGSSDPRKRSIFYFLSNPEWYTVNVAAAKKGKRAFKLTKKATVEAMWSYGHYYLSSVFNEKPYYKRNKRWYTKDKQGHYILTKEAPPEAQANYYEFFGNLGLFMNDEYPWHA